MGSLKRTTGALAAVFFWPSRHGVDRRTDTPTSDDEVVEVLPRRRPIAARIARHAAPGRESAGRAARRHDRQALLRASAALGRSALRRPRARCAATVARPCVGARRRAPAARDAAAVSARVRRVGGEPARAPGATDQRAQRPGPPDAGDGAARAGPIRRFGCRVPADRQCRCTDLCPRLPRREPALRGEVAAARRSFESMLADASLPRRRVAGSGPRLPSSRSATVARRRRMRRTGRAPAGPDTYAALAYADFLIRSAGLPKHCVS